MAYGRDNDQRYCKRVWRGSQYSVAGAEQSSGYQSGVYIKNSWQSDISVTVSRSRSLYREESDYLPHNYVKNSIVYTGTHDNDTTVGWYTQLNRKDKAFARKFPVAEFCRCITIRDRIIFVKATEVINPHHVI